MPTWTKSKIPWLKIALVGILILFVVVVVGFAFPGAGAAMIGGITGGLSAVYAFFFVSPSWISVVVACTIVGSIIILVAYRKYFFRQKVSDQTLTTATPQLQGGLISTQPLSTTPIPQQIVTPTPVLNNKQEVTTST